jgi:L-asparaginase
MARWLWLARRDARCDSSLATRKSAGVAPESTRPKTYGYPGAEIDLLKRGLIPAGYLSGLKARLLLSLVMRDRNGAGKVAEAFAPYQ